MNQYYYDPKTNTLHGPLDRMPPVWDYGFPPDGPSDSQLASAEADYDDAWKAFNIYLQSLPSHPHTFTGESRVVPEDEIKWEERDDFVRGNYMNICKVCKVHFGATDKLWFLCPTHSKYKVATPKITGEPSIPAHIVDDMKLDSYYDGFKDGSKLTEEVKRDKHQNCNCPNEQHNEGCLFHPNNDGAPGYTSTSGEEDKPTWKQIRHAAAEYLQLPTHKQVAIWKQIGYEVPFNTGETRHDQGQKFLKWVKDNNKIEDLISIFPIPKPPLTTQPDKPEDEEESLLDIAKSMYESAKKLLEQLKNG